jgi:hypothetical protein
MSQMIEPMPDGSAPHDHGAPVPPPPSAMALLGRWLLAGVVSGVLFTLLPPFMLGGWLLYGLNHLNFRLIPEIVGPALLIALLAGLVIGVPQALAARPILPAPASAWVLTTILGAVAGFMVGYFGLFLDATSLAIGSQMLALAPSPATLCPSASLPRFPPGRGTRSLRTASGSPGVRTCRAGAGDR